MVLTSGQSINHSRIDIVRFRNAKQPQAVHFPFRSRDQIHLGRLYGSCLVHHLFQVEETKKAQEELKQRAKEARQQMRDLEKDPSP